MGAVEPDAGTSQRTRRHLYGPVLVLGVLGALGVTVGASRPWISATSTVQGLPTIHAAASGTDLAPLAGALGVVVLAGFGAVIATRGWVRRGLGAAILVASVVVLVSVVDPSGATDILTSGLSAKGWSAGGYRTTTQPWRWLVLVSSVVTALAGTATAWYGGQWAVMGARYDAPSATGPTTPKPAEELTETDVWQAIDRGRDPTQEP
ncbi:MAG: Trp biosynthesis-associated membrane protein [Actinomycetota bacterium]|nr:Trp biosynthesis-associated membrane protein [Actinomycetota bacterium]